jgi:hypothetical protein
MHGTPGTVSRILWHFTGGPIRERHAYRTSKELKSEEKSYEALVAILKSKELRLGSCPERIDVMRDLVQASGIGPYRQATPMWGIQSALLAPVCCLADIPIMHLPYHSARYGKMAIGFHRGSVVKAGFNPVLYQLDTSPISEAIQKVIEGFDFISSFELGYDFPVTEQLPKPDETPDEEIKRITRNTIADARRCACLIASFLKPFRAAEFESIYAEREWRSTNPFPFSYDDIAMVVAPTAGRYFSRLCNDALEMAIPRSIPRATAS